VQSDFFFKNKNLALLFARNQRTRKCSNIEFGALLSLSLGSGKKQAEEKLKRNSTPKLLGKHAARKIWFPSGCLHSLSSQECWQRSSAACPSFRGSRISRGVVYFRADRFGNQRTVCGAAEEQGSD
jgi:hypothetical protein